MPHADFGAAMAEALAFIDKVSHFYDKYHILECEERHSLQHRLKQTKHEWAKRTGFEQQHVDFLEVLIRELRLHYQEWIQDDLVARKHWLSHPGESLNRLMLQSTNTTAMMQGSIAHQSRKLITPSFEVKEHRESVTPETQHHQSVPQDLTRKGHETLS